MGRRREGIRTYELLFRSCSKHADLDHDCHLVSEDGLGDPVILASKLGQQLAHSALWPHTIAIPAIAILALAAPGTTPAAPINLLPSASSSVCPTADGWELAVV
jgi:hypothetical protein